MCGVLQVYLADYGLAYRYCPGGVHKEYTENPKKGHNGTMEYTSLDAHLGVGEMFTFQPYVQTHPGREGREKTMEKRQNNLRSKVI